MKPFADQITADIAQLGAAGGVPPKIAAAARWKLNLLVAAYETKDLTIIGGGVRRWPNAPDSVGIEIAGRWFITFRWTECVGASEIRIERRK